MAAVGLSVVKCAWTLPMGGAKAGKKRKKDKHLPSSQTVESENKRLMTNNIGAKFTSPNQTMSQPQAGQFNPYVSPGTFSYSASILDNGQAILRCRSPIPNHLEPP